MKKYVIKRLLLMLPTFFGITLVTYGMVRLAPGDNTQLKAGMDALKQGALSQEVIDQERALYGLDKPIIIGYAEWLWKFVRLDFGDSRKDGKPVLSRIGETLPVTITLSVITIVVIYIISVPMGILTAVRKDSMFDRWTSLLLFILYSLPSFWVALLLLTYLAGGEYLDLFPLGGITSDWTGNEGFFTRAADFMWHLVLPVITLTYGGFAFLSRYTRANMLEVINQQYITTARSKGLSEKRVVLVHAFRNSMVPLVTLMASLLPGLIGGSVIVESIFSIPGIGRLGFEAVLSRDIPVIMAIASISAFLTLAGILLADIMYAVVDPRIRLDGKA
jgi:peptide/nickel transport system permease protein